jgi:outer membrane immunogenic protein
LFELGGSVMRISLWGSVAIVIAGVGVAAAADLSPAPVYKAPVYKAPILCDWCGFYVGVNGGYGWSEGSYLPIVYEVDPVVKQKGGLGGGQVGYNWQFGQVVVGVEGDFDGADIKGTDGIATFKTKELASIRGRLGYAVLPDLLAYGTGGAGWRNTEISDAFSSATLQQWGWAAGAGLEYKFYGHWIARAEYLHYDFDAPTVTLSTVVGTFGHSVDVVRGGLSYKF